MQMETIKQHPPLPTIYFNVKTGEMRLCQGEVQAYAGIFSAPRVECALAELPRFLREAKRLLIKKNAAFVGKN
jgi:hypothetical protein